MLEAPTTVTPLPPTHEDNGVLGKVPAKYLGEAQMSLPPADTATEEVMRVEVDTTLHWVGKVRLTFIRYRYGGKSKRKGSGVTWLCKHAEPIE